LPSFRHTLDNVQAPNAYLKDVAFRRVWFGGVSCLMAVNKKRLKLGDTDTASIFTSKASTVVVYFMVEGMWWLFSEL